MRYASLIFSLLLFVAYSCNSESSSTAGQPDLAKALIGTWESVSVNVLVQSADSIEGESYEFVIGENEWETKIGSLPILSYYETENNTYRMLFRNASTLPDGDMVRGKWFVNDNVLRLVTEKDTNEYEVTLDGGLMTFKQTVDWDGDGATDDEYTAVHRKISNYTR
ncbi:MAG: hypothetical protein NWS63_08160 [Saprospiraceae bacterium]|jgi:hypothetical protein|nr:hypothetical protein [Saprospiraceae bacterium]MDP4999276.1 hypothetical protein [Saprospiraceae bacterium]